eukprot:COSAG06_NODE_2025_length_7808_cov_3.765728_1_plen_72_part_10
MNLACQRVVLLCIRSSTVSLQYRAIVVVVVVVILEVIFVLILGVCSFCLCRWYHSNRHRLMDLLSHNGGHCS